MMKRINMINDIKKPGAIPGLVSICLPTYCRADDLKRCLKSIEIQDYPSIEVIITDDSPDNSCFNVAEEFKSRLNISYLKNSPAIGAPTNWNLSLDRANGEFVKLLHQDDFFTEQSSLSTALAPIICGEAEWTIMHTKRYSPSQGFLGKVTINSSQLTNLMRNPFKILRGNILGNPSVITLRNNNFRYDCNIKHYVDLDYYLQFLLLKLPPAIIEDDLMAVTQDDPNQLTAANLSQPFYEFKELVYCIHKYMKLGFFSLQMPIAIWELFEGYEAHKQFEHPKYLQPNDRIERFAKRIFLIFIQWRTHILNTKAIPRKLKNPTILVSKKASILIISAYMSLTSFAFE